MGIPQILILSFYILNLGASLALHGKPQTGKFNFWSTLVVTVMVLALLYWGGFWS